MIINFIKKYIEKIYNNFIKNIDLFIIIFLILMTLIIILYKKYEKKSNNKNIKEMHN